MKVVVYRPVKGNSRAKSIAEALAIGFERHGHEVIKLTSFDGRIIGDLVTAYGWVNKPLFDAYPNYIYWDLGYWNRQRDGNYRFGVNDWDTFKVMPINAPSDRYNKYNFDLLEISQSKILKRNEILIAAMSKKGARTHGYAFNQWENSIRKRIGSSYNINIRAKPKTGLKLESLSEALDRARLVIAHHSNVAIDALLRGVPCYVEKGVGLRISQSKLTEKTIREPWFPDEAMRLQTLWNTAYCQWSIAEMASGEAWDWINNAYKFSF